MIRSRLGCVCFFKKPVPYNARMRLPELRKNFYRLIIYPKSDNKDQARKEYILNILLVGSIFLAFTAFLVSFINSLIYLGSYRGESPLFMGVVVISFSALLFVSRIGKSSISAQLLIIILFTLSAYTSYQWGADSQQALLIYSLLIVMSGVLISSKSAFMVMLASGVTIMSLALLEINGIHLADYSWKMRTVRVGGALVFVITLGVIAIVSWLSNKEIDKALRRARSSEAALRKERDLLEVKVEQRTKELRQTQAEKLVQLYKFAEFGRNASGLFHDLVNPLTLVSLNLAKLSDNKIVKDDQLSEIDIALTRAISGVGKLESYISAARKQLQNQEVLERFSLTQEISQAIELLGYRLNELRVGIEFDPTTELRLYGNPVKFSQLITNLVSNAIDSFDKNDKKTRQIKITLDKTKDLIKLAVSDNGSGIDSQDLPKIFTPLFTTKPTDRGVGLGLSISKEIVEKSFRGKISADSKQGFGTTFAIEFPTKRNG